MKRRSANTLGKRNKKIVHADKQNLFDPALELECASPIIDLVSNNKKNVATPIGADDSLLPNLNLNAEALQKEVIAAVNATSHGIEDDTRKVPALERT